MDVVAHLVPHHAAHLGQIGLRRLDLLIDLFEQLGAVDRAPVTLMFRGGARDLGDGDVRAYASRESGRLVVEINTDDGTQVTHTYQLEAQGKRLRVKTQVLSSKAPIPGGIPFERLYNRVDPAAAVGP
jgi:hypothetical protein